MVNIISAEALRDKFGPQSPVYTNIKRDLLRLWEEVKDESEIKVKFSYWLNTFKRIYDKTSLDLFIDHTYLIILTKIIVYLRFSKPANNNLIEVINGTYFAKRGITNFLEEDFSEWLIHSKITDKSLILFSDLLEKATDYDFSGIDEDILKWLYEEIVVKEERHKAGEYYTPEWLVQLILKEVITLWEESEENVIPKILDPACGSGTFLYHIITILGRKGVPKEDIIKNVVGMDINPLATSIAKANYLMALSDFIEDLERVTLPIYTKDSLKSPDLFDYDAEIDYDIIVGNPPWVVMRAMGNKEYQNFLKKEALKYHLLEKKDVHLFTQMELATLSFCKCADLYLKRGGIIAFVMPRSVLAGTIHHVNFRKFRRPPIKLAKIIDLEAVNPIFNMPACVLIGLKEGVTKYPVLLDEYRGDLPDRNGKFFDVRAELSSEVREYTPPDFPVETSYYYDKFKVGASIFPRSLYFVDFISSIPPEISVKTSEEIFKIVKDPWRVVLVGDIQEVFLYASLLAWEMIPFGYIKLHPVVLPIREHSDEYRLLEVGELQGSDFRGSAEWFKKAEAVWAERRTEKSRNRFPSLSDRLNYNNLLTSQNRSKRYVVLYNATGTNVVSCVVDRASVPHFEVDGQEVKPRGFIMDVKTWFFETDNETEAHYLCAIFNSETINELIKPLQPKGLFGARAIHRRPLLFPIPEFGENDNLHIELAEISKICHEKIKFMRFTRKNNIRGEVRKGIQSEIEAINQVVAKLLNPNNHHVKEEIKCLPIYNYC
jgi:SAM-dependent methyltransferase